MIWKDATIHSPTLILYTDDPILSTTPIHSCLQFIVSLETSVPQNISLLHLHYGSMIKIQIASAYIDSDDFDDNIGRVNNRRFIDFDDLDIIFFQTKLNAFQFSPLGSAQAGFLLGFEILEAIVNSFMASSMILEAAFPAVLIIGISVKFREVTVCGMFISL